MTAAPRADLRPPGDHGLAGLGVVMHAAGTLSMVLLGAAGLLAMIATMALNQRAGPAGDGTLTIWIALVTVTQVVRSWAHRTAGARLALAGAVAPFAAIHRYLVIAAIQTVVWIVFAAVALHEPARAIAPGVIALVAWPAVVAVVITLPRFRAMEAGVPLDPDRGLDGLGLVMTVFGATGVGFGLLALVGWLQLPGDILGRLYGAVAITVIALLVVRSVLHGVAGWRAATDRDLDRVIAAATRYGNMGLFTAIAAAANAVLFMMSNRADPIGIVGVAAVTGSLVVWPLIVRRLFAERFAAEPTVDERHELRPVATDRGLAWLGWLLVGLGVIAVVQALPAAIDADAGARSPLGSLVVIRSARAWWLVAIAALQLWAGIELVRLVGRERIAAAIYGVVGTALAIYAYAPAVVALRGFAREAALVPLVATAGVVAAAVVVPLATVVLVSMRTRA